MRYEALYARVKTALQAGKQAKTTAPKVAKKPKSK